MFQSLKAMPFPSWIYALALASLSAQVAFVIRIFRRCKAKPWLTTTPEVSGLWPAVAVLLLGLLLPAGAIAFVEPARRAMIALAIGPPGSELSYYTLFPSPQDRLSLLPYVPGWIAISALLGACALTLALTTRWRVLARLSATVLQHAHSGRDVVLDVYQPAQE